MRTEYKVIVHPVSNLDDILKFEDEITKALNAGFSLAGGVSTTTTSPNTIHYSQAVYR